MGDQNLHVIVQYLLRSGDINGLKVILDLEGYEYAYYPRGAKEQLQNGFLKTSSNIFMTGQCESVSKVFHTASLYGTLGRFSPLSLTFSQKNMFSIASCYYFL